MTEEQVKAIVITAIAHAKAYGSWLDEEELGLFWVVSSDLSVVFSKTISMPGVGGTGPNNEQELVSDDSYEIIYKTSSFKHRELNEQSTLDLFEEIQRLGV